MITSKDLGNIAKMRFDEAKILFENSKYDGAVYLCGYALECILKRKIALLMDWDGYPDNKKEFESIQAFKTHDLDVLLRLSGIEKMLTNDTPIYAKWQIAKEWKSEIRYKNRGSYTDVEAKSIINANRDIINYILSK